MALVAIIFPSAFGAAINDADRMYSEQLQQQIAEYYRQSNVPESQIAQAVYDFSLANPANVEAVSDLRFGLVCADGWRSLLFLVLGAAFLGLFYTGKGRRGLVLAGIGVLVFADLYTVDKRYVSHSSFGPADEGGEIVFTPDAIDNAILADGDGEYRVFDIPVSMVPTAHISTIHSAAIMQLSCAATKTSYSASSIPCSATDICPARPCSTIPALPRSRPNCAPATA